MKTIAVLGVLGALVAGCGGSSGGGSCGTVAPCGGAVEGTWKVTSSCIKDGAFLGIDVTDICDTATFDAATTKISGTATYEADMTYQVALTVQPIFTLRIPTSCFPPGASCADFAAALEEQSATDPTVMSSSCTSSGDACSCLITSVVQNISETGTFTTAGTSITETPSGEAATTEQYCVAGNELHRLEVDMDMPMGKIQADIVLTKQ